MHKPISRHVLLQYARCTYILYAFWSGPVSRADKDTFFNSNLIDGRLINIVRAHRRWISLWDTLSILNVRSACVFFLKSRTMPFFCAHFFSDFSMHKRILMLSTVNHGYHLHIENNSSSSSLSLETIVEKRTDMLILMTLKSRILRTFLFELKPIKECWQGGREGERIK